MSTRIEAVACFASRAKERWGRWKWTEMDRHGLTLTLNTHSHAHEHTHKHTNT